MQYLIALYLRDHGWQLFDEYSGASIWLSPHGDELAITTDAVSTLRELAQLEDRSVEAIWRQIQGVQGFGLVA